MSWQQSPSFLQDFGIAQGYGPENYVRIVKDIDRNSGYTSDYIAFGYDHVTIAWGGTFPGPLSSKGPGFATLTPGSYAIKDFGVAQGWDSTYLRGVDHVGGTTLGVDATIWGAGNSGFFYYKPVSEVAHQDSAGKTFYEPEYQGPFFISDFGHNQGWSDSNGIQLVTVKSTDTSASIVGFGNNGLVIARDTFGAVAATQTYAVSAAVGNISGKYDNHNDIRTFKDAHGDTLDFNKDGIADFAGFGPRGLETALGSINSNNQFVIANPTVAKIGSGVNGADLGDAQGWTNQNTVRILQDLNHDGRTDIIAFGYDGVYVAMGVNNPTQPFGTLYKAGSDFGIKQGWNTTDHIRLVGDVSGDGVDDIVAFGGEYTFLVTGAVNGAGQVTFDTNQINQADHRIHDLTVAQGWNIHDHVRTLGDVDGSGHLDIVASGYAGTSAWFFA